MMKESIIHDEEWPTQKIESEINHELDILETELDSIIKVEEIQSIMDDFCYLTNMATAILDLKGRVIEATGWQDLCTKFHRINPKTAQNCTESDFFLAKNLKPGEYVDYKCKNGLWDVVTPLYVGTKHLGNIFTGQFFYDDEEIDEEFFMKQAEVYKFDKDSYLNAVRRIPRYNRETVNHLMSFLVKFTTYISRISLVNIQLEKEIRERKQTEEELKSRQEMLSAIVDRSPIPTAVGDSDGSIISLNKAVEELTGYRKSEISNVTDWVNKLYPDNEYRDVVLENIQSALRGDKQNLTEFIITRKDGATRDVDFYTSFFSDGLIIQMVDITERKQAEKNWWRVKKNIVL